MKSYIMLLCIVLENTRAVPSINSIFPNLKAIVPILDGKIVGGESVDIKDYPHQVSLQYRGTHICGGSIINEKYVVTAAHCTDGSATSALSVRSGTSLRNIGGTVIPVAKIIQNPQYNNRIIDYDISILELSMPLTLSKTEQPVKLPEMGKELAAGTEVTCTGWGAVREGGPGPAQLQAVTVPVVARDDCQKAYKNSNITERMICAGIPEGGKDSCQVKIIVLIFDRNFY